MKKLAPLTIVLIFSFSAAYADNSVQYTNESFARLSYTYGNVYIQRATELDYEEGVLNMPITEGDRMGTTEGRAEIYMGRGKYLRLDQNTKMDFLNLPNPGDDLTSIQIWRGNIFFSIMSLKKEKAVEIHTDDASLYVLEAGLYRIDVRGEETEIFVFKGLVEAAGEAGSVLIKDAQRLEAIDGYFLGRPSGFAAVAEDSFDRWSEQRDHEVRKRMAQRYMPDELEDFEYELAFYGEWTYVFPYGYVWIPGGVEAAWRPYWHGRWMWLPTCGWTWLPYEPWGWVTGHFGRWHWSIRLGWYWIPTTVWGPGWVHWYSGYDYVGWAPVSYWGYPGVVINNVYYGRHTDYDYPYRSRALTVIHKDQLRARNISKVSLNQESITNIGRISMAKTQPVIKPSSSSQIRLKTLRTSPVDAQKSSDAVELKRVKISSPEKMETKEERNIPKSSTQTKSKKTSSTLGKITRILTGGKSQATTSISSKTSSSKSSSSKAIKSNSKSKSSSTTKKSSSSKSSSSRSRSVSKKVKKKK